VFYFIKVRRTEAHRNGARDSHQKLPKSAIEPDVRTAFGHFIAKTRSLEDGREDRKRKRIGTPGGRGPRGRQRRKRGRTGAVRDTSTEVFSSFGRKAIVKYVAVRRSIFGNEYCRSTSTDALRRETNNADGKLFTAS
jgi:hypothetical protein